jgi:hypothetical protein
MICLAVRLNERLVCIAGHPRAELLSAIVGGGKGTQWDDPVAFHVACLYTSPTGEPVHHYLIDRTILANEDRLTFSLVQSDLPTPIPHEPSAISSGESALQEWEDVALKTNPPALMPSAGPREVQMQLRLNDAEPVGLSIPVDQEHALCSVTWIKRRPDRCEVHARTFSGAEPSLEADECGTDWLRNILEVGDRFEVSMSALGR